MSKKKFTDGMESLFTEDIGENIQEELNLFQSESKKPAKSKKESAPEKRSSKKHFSSDMQSFLTQAFEESLEKRLNKEQSKPTIERRIKKKTRKPLSGIDALIRNTLEPDSIEIQELPVKRVTISFDRQKLEKLQSIAKVKKTYLREVINEIIDDFISNYDPK